MPDNFRSEFSGIQSPKMETIAIPVATDPFIGKTIGNCELIEKINEGGTSFIYRAIISRFRKCCRSENHAPLLL